MARNANVTSAAATPVSITLAAVVGQRARLYRVDGYTSGGTASLTITDGGSTIYTTPTSFLTTTPVAISWLTVPLEGKTNSALVITAGSAGGANTATISVQADVY